MVHFIWPVLTENPFSIPLTKVDIHFGHVRMHGTPYPISWIIFIFDSEPSSTYKLLKSRWVQLVPKIYDKRDDFDFDVVTLSFLDGDVPRRASYGVYMSQLIRFPRVCNNVADFNARNKG